MAGCWRRFVCSQGLRCLCLVHVAVQAPVQRSLLRHPIEISTSTSTYTSTSTSAGAGKNSKLVLLVRRDGVVEGLEVGLDHAIQLILSNLLV
ncbi:hypothetical protein HYQ46_008947 [Verticillium longisporum]|nr:hypothetical protein HYQ46_008947 [Verticillium longisporum]